MIQLKNILMELGNSPFPFKKDSWSKDEIIYTFNVDEDTSFDVNIFVRSKNKIEIDFQSNYSFETTNRNKDTFKILATIKAIILEVLSKLKTKKYNIDTLVYSASVKKVQLYKKLIQHVFPNAKFGKDQYGNEEVKITPIN